MRKQTRERRNGLIKNKEITIKGKTCFAPMKKIKIMTKKIQMIAALALLIMAASCSEDDPAPVRTPDVYAAGLEYNGSTYVATVWKNGVATALTDGANDAQARSVYVVGSDVYAAGYEYNGSMYVAKVWKNGVATSLTDGANTAYAYGIFVK
jgi:hypothetical protein